MRNVRTFLPLLVMLSCAAALYAEEFRIVGALEPLDAKAMDASAVPMLGQIPDTLEEQEAWLEDQRWMLSQPSAAAPEQRHVPQQLRDPSRSHTSLTHQQTQFRDSLIQMFGDTAEQMR